MAALSPTLNTDFEGTLGPAAAGDIGASQITGAGTATFDGADPKQGTTCLKFTGAANQINARWDFTAVTTFWEDIYVKTPSAVGTGTPIIMQWVASDLTTVVGALRMNLADLSIALRDAATTVWTSTGLTPGTWVRISVKSVPNTSTGHRVRIYTSSAGNGSTPDQDSGDQVATGAGATSVASWRLGVLTNATMTYYVDRQRADNATEPAGLTTGLPPVVNAGPDLTKETGSGTFTITGTATPSSGATIASRSWQILSGITVTTSGTTTDTVTITAPGTTGTTVMRYTATDNVGTGQSTSDDVTLTWVTPGQTLYPAADVSNAGGWLTQSGGTSSLFASIDEPVLNTADYVATPQAPSAAVYRMRLQSKPAPTNTTGWYLRVNKRDFLDVATTSLTVKLYEADGTTLRKAWAAITTVNSADTEYQLTLTSSEVTAITTWTSGLIVELTATVG